MYRRYIGIMEKKTETRIVGIYLGYIGVEISEGQVCTRTLLVPFKYGPYLGYTEGRWKG